MRSTTIARVSSPARSGKSGVHLAAGPSAELLLKDEEFQEAWKHLFHLCPWATGFQSPGFVTTWYSVYQTHFMPLIVTDFGTGTAISGLLALAISKESDELVVAGAHHAEYQVWIASPESSDCFIQQALQKMRLAFPRCSLTFKYLPPLTPIKGINFHRPAGVYCALTACSRPFRELSGPSKSKNTNRLLNRLARQGEIRFETVEEPERSASLLDELIPHYDLRQGAINGVMPFRDDPLKRAFHLELMKIPNLMHAVTLRLGETFLGGHLGVCDQNTVYIGVLAHSPFYAKQSPGTLLVKMLGLQLAKDGYRYLDLTPGGHYKERFATGHDEVHKLQIFFKCSHFLLHRFQRRLEQIAKKTLRRFGLLSLARREFFEKLRLAALAGSPLRVFPWLFAKLWQEVELRVYLCPAQEVAKFQYPQVVWRDRIEDLRSVYFNDAGRSRKKFLAKCLERLENGLRVYTCVEDGRLIFCGWVTDHREKVFMAEVQREFCLPLDSALVFEQYSDSRKKDLDFHAAALCQMLHDAAATPDIGQIYVALNASDIAQRQAVEQLGLAYVGSFFRLTLFGKALFRVKSETEKQLGLAFEGRPCRPVNHKNNHSGSTKLAGQSMDSI